MDLLTEFSCGSTDESNRSISFFYLWLCRGGEEGRRVKRGGKEGEEKREGREGKERREGRRFQKVSHTYMYNCPTWSMQCTSSGQRKAAVFPEPVLAMPMMSRPLIAAGIAYSTKMVSSNRQCLQ